MKVNPQVITLLNDVLTAELTAVNQYFLHARLCHHWGYEGATSGSTRRCARSRSRR